MANAIPSPVLAARAPATTFVETKLGAASGCGFCLDKSKAPGESASTVCTNTDPCYSFCAVCGGACNPETLDGCCDNVNVPC